MGLFENNQPYLWEPWTISTIHCPNCGNKIENATKICPYCGIDVV